MRGPREGVYPQRYSTDRGTKQMARCRPAPQGWGALARWLRCSLLTDRCGYARRSRLASEPNPLQQNRNSFLHRPLVAAGWTRGRSRRRGQWEPTHTLCTCATPRAISHPPPRLPGSTPQRRAHTAELICQQYGFDPIGFSPRCSGAPWATSGDARPRPTTLNCWSSRSLRTGLRQVRSRSCLPKRWPRRKRKRAWQKALVPGSTWPR